MLSKADVKYLDIVERILKDGYYSNNRTGIPTYKLPHQIMQFDLADEFREDCSFPFEIVAH